MEPESPAQTEIIEEKPVRAGRGKAMMWTFVGVSTSLVLVAALFLFIGSLKKPTHDLLILAEDREQQRYDSQQEAQARNKASPIQNAPFLLRKGSDSEASAQAESLFRELNRDNALSSQSKAAGDPAKAEEDLIASVIREPQPQAPAEPSYRASHPPAPTQPLPTATGSGERELAEAIWTGNRQTDVVEFTLDTQGRLIGRIRRIAQTLDMAELLFYMSVLSRECDRFEHLLTGEDEA